MLSAPSPSHQSAEFLSGVLEQNLNLIGTAPIYGAELPPRPTGLVQPNTLSAENVDRMFGTYGGSAFASLGQPEIGVRVVCRSGIQIQIKLERNMFRLKLRVAPLDRGNKNPSDPFGAVLECRGSPLAVRWFGALASPLASICKGITQRWHMQLPVAVPSRCRGAGDGEKESGYRNSHQTRCGNSLDFISAKVQTEFD